MTREGVPLTVREPWIVPWGEDDGPVGRHRLARGWRVGDAPRGAGHETGRTGALRSGHDRVVTAHAADGAERDAGGGADVDHGRRQQGANVFAEGGDLRPAGGVDAPVVACLHATLIGRG